MSGVSDNKPCPVCGRDMDVYTDWKPFDTVNMRCVHCGFYGYVKTGMECEEDRRASWEASGLDAADFEPLSDIDRKGFLENFKELCGAIPPDEECRYLGLAVQDKPKVVISVCGGVADVATCPDEVEVEIVDYDNREAEETMRP
jgi:hypothetical protein